MRADILIIGAGPAGLAASIRLADLAKQQGRELNICVLEKGAYVGAHNISGGVFESTALTELIPDWKAQGAPLTIKATHSELHYLTASKHFRMPQLPMMHGPDNYIISLSELCRWLGEQAESRGVNIFPGFPAAKLLFDDTHSKVIGAQTVDTGLDKSKNPTDQFQPGIQLFAQHTLLAEGARGSLTELLFEKTQLRDKCDPQTYALGIKELWRINPSKHQPGHVMHTVGFPLKNTYGGGFIYHFKDDLISIGLISGLDYKNPLFSPFVAFQEFKKHPLISALLDDAECVEYGARALNEGGYQSIPTLTFPGVSLIGCGAGFVNVGKIKGIHNAIRSGMLAAQACLQNADIPEALTSYEETMKTSPIFKELYRVRNIRPAFKKGLLAGMLYTALDQFLLRGKAPYTLHHKTPDHLTLLPSKEPYNAPSFKARLNAVFLSGTTHREGQPCHLQLKNNETPVTVNYNNYNAPESRYCPAGVYEFIKKDDKISLQINAANCVHCKTCDIKDPRQNIKWAVPEGGDGPRYQLM